MAEQKYITYIVEVNTSDGKIKIDGLTKGFVSASNAAKQLETSVGQVNKNLGQTTSKAGLAGAAVVEIGRTISDANYGMMAMANNLQQVSTLFITLISTTGGLVNGVKALASAFMGPLGLIVIFQSVIAWMEKTDREQQQLGRSVNNVEEAYRNAATELELLLTLSDDLTSAERDNIKERIALLREEAKVRAQVSEIQRLQSELLKIEARDTAEFVSWYQSIWQAIKSGSIFSSGPGGTFSPNQTFMESVLGIGESEKAAQIKNIEDKISEIVEGIDPEAIKRITDEKVKEGKRGKDQDKLQLDSLGLVGMIVPTPEEINNALTQLWAGLEIKQRMQKMDAEEEKRLMKEAKKRREEDLEHRLIMFQSIGDGLQSLGYLLGKSTEEGKAIAAAGALIDTYGAIDGILKNVARTPAGAIPGYAIAQAAAVGLFGFAQVKKIYSTKVPKGRGGGSSGGATPSLPTPQQPSFNIVGATQGNQIRDTIQDALGKPIRAYVTTRDIRSGEELDRNIVRGATVG